MALASNQMSGKAEKIVEIARSLLGKPYKYGAKMEEAPHYFDCSSFTKYIFGEAGIEIPRSTIEQAAAGKEVELADVQEGDLIFLKGSRGHYNPKFPIGVGHVGIYTKDETVVHALSQRVKEERVAIGGEMTFLEEGKVVEMPLSEYLERWKPLVVIKRFIL